MLDTTLFNLSLPDNSIKDSDALVLSGCRVTLAGSSPYSELDELNYYPLNSNDYEAGRTDIEFSFDNILKNQYSKFYIQCVAIRIDNQTLCKIDKNYLSESLHERHFTKVTKNGKLALGLSYYFRSDKEKEQLLNCKLFCVEGFFALNKKTNVYGFMCRIKKKDDSWELIEGNTYKIYKNTSIKNLYH